MLAGMTSAPMAGGPAGHRTVTEASIQAFGCITGDYARMHFDHHEARRSPLGTPIAHGLLGACWAVGMLSQHAPDRLGIGDTAAVVRELAVRFRRAVKLGDTLSVRWSDDPEGGATAFELRNQDDEVATEGTLRLGRDGDTPPSDPPLVGGSWSPPPPGEVLHAEDLLERGPRGESLGRTLGEADVVAFANEVGELDPRARNREFAEKTAAGARCVPPMLCFCIGFGDFLRELLRAPMPAAGFAGHLGDRWRMLRPVRFGDTLRARHQPVSCTPSRSRPEMAIVEFGLELLNQRDEIVQQGAIQMMIPRRQP